MSAWALSKGQPGPSSCAKPFSSLPASLSPALFLRSYPSRLLCIPCAGCSLQGLCKPRVAALPRGWFPGQDVCVLPDKSCAESRSLTHCWVSKSECPWVSPACKQCRNSNPRESRLGVSMARHSWEAGCLFQRTSTDPGTPYWGYLSPVRK